MVLTPVKQHEIERQNQKILKKLMEIQGASIKRVASVVSVQEPGITRAQSTSFIEHKKPKKEVYNPRRLELVKIEQEN